MPLGKKRSQKPPPPPRRTPVLPLLRMFGLGIIAVLACLWALQRPKRPWEFRPAPAAPPSNEIEIEWWDGSVP